MRLWDSVRAQLGGTKGVQHRFLGHLLGLLLLLPGRATFRNLSRYSPYHEKTFSRWFRREFDWVAVNGAAIAAVIPAEHPQIWAFDPSFVPKSGQRTYGLDRFWNSTQSRVQRGLEINTVAWIDVAANTAYHLSTAQTPPQPAGTADETRIDAYLDHLRQVVQRQSLPPQPYLVVDGYFAKQKFIDGVRDLPLHLIGKLRSDANLRYLYTGPRRPGPGCPKRYDGKVRWGEWSRFTKLATDHPRYVLYHADVNSVCFRRNLRVVVVLDTHTQRYAILFSTDLTLSPRQIYQYYQARFQIEFLFRDAKQFTGLTACQARTATALHNHFNASLTAVSFAKLETHPTAPGTPVPFSMASLKRRYFNQHLLDRILDYLASGLSLEKFSPAYEALCNYGIIAEPAT